MGELIDGCGCVLERIFKNERELHMIDCPLHSAVIDLLKACKVSIAMMLQAGLTTKNDERINYQGVFVMLRNAIEKAEGRE